jgi:hypothetical protein
MLTVVSAGAQSKRSSITNIPFDFVVGGKILPAGDYTIEPNRRDSENVWLIKPKDGGTSAFVITNPVRATETQETTKLVFHKYGDQYFLSQIWTAGGNSGRELSMPRRERLLAKKVEREKIVLTNGSAGRN